MFDLSFLKKLNAFVAIAIISVKVSRLTSLFYSFTVGELAADKWFTVEIFSKF